MAPTQPSDGTSFEIMEADIFRPLRPTARGHNHILVLIDHHTRWAELIAAPEPTAELVAEAIFEQWIWRWGTMMAPLTDNGRQFAARLLQQLTDVYGIKDIYSSSYNLRGSSVVESYMRTLKTTLNLCTQAFQTDWDIALKAAALAYRATPHTVTAHTPFFLVTGQEVVLPLSRGWRESALCPLCVTWLEAFLRCRVEVRKAHELAADENARAQTSEICRLRPRNHVTFRVTSAESQAEGMFSPLLKRPYVIVSDKPAGVTADIRGRATGHMATAKRCRRKFVEAIPQHAPYVKHLPRAVFH